MFTLYAVTKGEANRKIAIAKTKDDLISTYTYLYEAEFWHDKFKVVIVSTSGKQWVYGAFGLTLLGQNHHIDTNEEY